ncbi:MAG: bifunctional precorrin-2 dehydrogenase/sirohydrochlorin ferrochelatase, partial [Leptospiraceae bacterium]|nr:bifunctional precorrin-2 dehydrogenase/sirohydrochlorin ferrochelatase [Leptospiraceae bacterium]
IILPEIKSFKMEQCSLDYMEREFKESDLVGIDLLFSATNNSKVNQSITDLAKKHKIWANSVDDPLHCDFFSAAVFDRGPVRIALSTDGKFAGLSGSLKRTLEKLIPEESDEDFQKLMDLRTKIKLIEPNAQKRSDILKGIIRELEYKYFTVEK